MRGESIISALRIAFLTGLAALATACSSTQPDDLPPVVYMCPMLKDADVLEEHAGKCPKCGMELKPVRIVTAYSCLNNTAFIQAEPGKCRTNGTDLVPITASMYWVCPDSPDKRELNPGKCADGSDRIKKFEPRLHGDHNPRHGGQLFMADDGWHHLEGTYLAAGLLRVFFYDDWTRPLAPEGFTGSVIVKDSAGKELATVPLQASAISNAMDARIAKDARPLIATVRVRFKPTDAEKSFDFTFQDYSKEPGAPTGITSNPAPPQPAVPEPPPPQHEAVATTVVSDKPAAPATPAASEDVPAPVAMNAAIPGPFQPEPIPMTAREILVELNARTKELAEKVEQGAPLGEYWFPALRTKDLALALINDHLKEIPSRQRTPAENAADRLLRAAYAIDNFGDLGDRERLLSAYETFVTAVNDLKSAYASIR